MKPIVYGSSWCGWTRRAISHLDELEVEYDYIEVDSDPEAEALIASWNGGRAIRPTIAIGDDHWVNPTFDELDSELQTRGLLPA
ncbi:MAG TPA: glutaredoxin family protein [Abditibacteriaceae bacterium]|jgi:glutaredoxin